MNITVYVYLDTTDVSTELAEAHLGYLVRELPPNTKVFRRMMYGSSIPIDQQWEEGWGEGGWKMHKAMSSKGDVSTAMVESLKKDAQVLKDHKRNKQVIFVVYSGDYAIQPGIASVIKCGIQVILASEYPSEQYKRFNGLNPFYFSVAQISSTLLREVFPIVPYSIPSYHQRVPSMYSFASTHAPQPRRTYAPSMSSLNDKHCEFFYEKLGNSKVGEEINESRLNSQFMFEFGVDMDTVIVNIVDFVEKNWPKQFVEDSWPRILTRVKEVPHS